MSSLSISTSEKLTGSGDYEVSTLAGSGTSGDVDGTGTNASFNDPRGLATDTSGNIYVADYGNHKIRKITAEGVVTTLAGSGSSGYVDATGTGASFNKPVDVSVDSSGNVFVADTGNDKIRKITPSGEVSTFAAMSLASLSYMTIDSSNNIYIHGSESVSKVYKIDTDGNSTLFKSHTSGEYGGLDIDSSGQIWIADDGDHYIYKIATDGTSTNITNGNGTIGAEDGIAIDSSDNVYVANNFYIQKVNDNGSLTNIVTLSTRLGSPSSGASYISTDSSENLFVNLSDNTISKVKTPPAEAVDTIQTATQEIANLRAQVGANMTRLESEVSGVKMYDENLTNAISRITDVDIAQESTIYAKNNILQQAATAMLAQANVLPQSTLRLLGV